MHQPYRLLGLLADGRFHSGQRLGAELGLSRAAVWKLAHGLQALDLDVYAVPGKGYRLAAPIELLDRARILAAMGPAALRMLSGLEILPSVGSTHTELLERARQGLPSGFACLAEHQSAGRGRRGRTWISPFGANLYLSLLWRFEQPPSLVAGLGLAVGVSVARALQGAGIGSLGLKWPNDVLWQGRKLGGILLDLAGESTGPSTVVVGVGINGDMPVRSGAMIDQPWVDLRTVLGRSPERNRLAGLVLGSVLLGLDQFSREGLAPCLPAWNDLDVSRGRTVAVDTGHGQVIGTAMGLDPEGALLVSVHGETRRYLAGEVSLGLPA
jgi:BirA family biotin operon repressor/biotin-[acetyl-CoA-carboxylase] ligase